MFTFLRGDVSRLSHNPQYILHIVTHGSNGSLSLGTPRVVTSIFKKFKNKKEIPKPSFIIIYACHAADENGTARKIFDYFDHSIPVIGIGTCESVSMEEDGKEYPCGTMLSFLNCLVHSSPNDNIVDTFNNTLTLGICSKDEETPQTMEHYPPKIWGEKLIERLLVRDMFHIKDPVDTRKMVFNTTEAFTRSIRSEYMDASTS